jgi:hypothetical protein
MSTGVYVYSVPADRLRATPGSKDKALLDAVGSLEGFFKTIDEIAESLDEDEEKPPKCSETYRQIVNGEPFANGYGYVYGYAYEALCVALGAEMERPWTQIARSRDWFREINAALAAVRIQLRITDLLYRGPLIDIPEPDDLPALGWWNADEVKAAAIVFGALDLNRLDAENREVVQRVADAIEDIRSWIMTASERRGEWLVGVQC